MHAFPCTCSLIGRNTSVWTCLGIHRARDIRGQGHKVMRDGTMMLQKFQDNRFHERRDVAE